MLLRSIKSIFTIESNNHRIFGLDLLRAFAILIVIFSHSSQLLPEQVRQIVDLLFFHGGVGVSIFFVLSGFLIGKILIKQINNDSINNVDFHTLLSFWKRRWWRTLPTYFLVLGILMILNSINNPNFSIRGINRYIFFFQNSTAEISDFFFIESWSIAVEEWFYLIFPLLCWLLLRIFPSKISHTIIVSTLSIILFSTIYRYYYYFIADNEINYFITAVFARIDSIAFGVIAAYIQLYHNKFWNKRKNQWGILGLLMFCVYKVFIDQTHHILFINVFSYTLLSLMTCLFLPFLSEFKSEKFQFITKISLISYSMYLINLTLLQHWVIHQIPWNIFIKNEVVLIIVRYISFWTILLLMSIIMYKYFEIPMTNLRDRIKIKK